MDGVELAHGDGFVPVVHPISLVGLILSGMVAAGVQYGLALQLLLLNPFIQNGGISENTSSLMRFAGLISGLVVQPCVGLWSDKCCSRFGRRRPFILVGCLLTCIMVVILGFSSDIGYALGDITEYCSLYESSKWKGSVVFFIGYWVLGISINVVQAPARALMADLSRPHRFNSANAIYCFWMAFGNILGYSSGAYVDWQRWFPFLQTKACCEACANLKGALLVAVIFLIFCMIVTVLAGKETPLIDLQHPENGGPWFRNIYLSFRQLPHVINDVGVITDLTWLSWCPFILYGIDWMGREVYHGNPIGTQAQIVAYDRGSTLGALGMVLNSVVVGLTTFLIEPMCRKLTPRIVWAMSNFMVSMGMAAVAILSLYGVVEDAIGIEGRVKAAALLIFTALGFPLAILYSVPFAYIAHVAANNRLGQGLCAGVLSTSTLIPQMITLAAGPMGLLFSKGYSPAFVVASLVAFLCGLLGQLVLPNLPRREFWNAGFVGH